MKDNRKLVFSMVNGEKIVSNVSDLCNLVKYRFENEKELIDMNNEELLTTILDNMVLIFLKKPNYYLMLEQNETMLNHVKKDFVAISVNQIVTVRIEGKVEI